MSPKNMKWLAAAGAMSALGFSFASADYHMANKHMDNHGAMFSARGAETTKITFGGQFQAGFMYVDADQGGASSAVTTTSSNTDEQFVNFTINHLRLMTKAELAGDWTVLSNIDFMKKNPDANSIESSLSNDTSGAGIFIDKAYVQKVWNDHTFQLGYKKVAFGYEENTAETELPAIERSATTNFFTNLGSDLNSRMTGTANGVTESRQDRGFAGRKIGVHVNGAFDLENDHSIGYNVALTNGYSGTSFYSTKGSDVPAFFAGLDYGFMMNDFDMMLGLNFGFVAEGANGVKESGNVWGLNPYFAMDYENFNLVFEFFYGQIDDGKRDGAASTWGTRDDANPYGFLITPSYSYEDFEFVARFGWTDTDKFGTTVQNALGMPVANSNTGHWSRVNFYDEFWHIYVGMNYYMMDRAVKASVGYEYTKFDDALSSAVISGSENGVSFDDHTSAGSPKVHSLRTALQLVF